MKIIEEKENIKPQYKISAIGGKKKNRVAMFREKDSTRRHGIYKTDGGVFYNRYDVEDSFGEGDELSNRGVVGPFKTEEEAKKALKDFRPNIVEESMKRRARRMRESANAKVELVDRIKDWYKAEYPDDNLGDDIDDTIRFKDMVKMLNDGYDFYDHIGNDSVIRERIFDKLAKILGVDYDTIYYTWLYPNKYQIEVKRR